METAGFFLLMLMGLLGLLKVAFDKLDDKGEIKDHASKSFLDWLTRKLK